MTDPHKLLHNARDFAERKKFSNAEEFYKKTISLLEQQTDDSDKSKMELWSTKSEFLSLKTGYKTSDETWEDARKRGLDCLRYLHKCCKLNKEYYKIFRPRVELIVKQLIMTYGCILPEDKNHVVISCPIYLRRHTGLGKYSTSIAFTYEKIQCSICNRDMLDEECVHEAGETYDGILCEGLYVGIKPQHLAIVTKPKDPNAIGAKAIYEPKNEYFKQFDQEELKKARHKGLPLNCHSCRETQFDPSEITLEMFFEMQGQNLDAEPSF